MYLYKSIGGRSISIDNYTISVTGLASPNEIEALDDQIGILLLRYTDGVLDTRDDKLPAYFNTDSSGLVDHKGQGLIWATLVETLGGGSGTGPRGPAGPQGIQGEAGLAGTQGVAGIQGIQGTAGTTGLNGVDGSQGIQGITGIIGTSGTQGIQGITGPVGPIGPTGPAGSAGITGAAGTQGIQGIQGAQGIQGTIGSQGPAGTDGIIGVDGISGAKGDIGLTGPAGPVGTQGIQGSVGPKGDTGPTGDTGLKGADGNSIVLKGSVPLEIDLPLLNNANNDLYIVTATGHGFSWSGLAWVDVGLIQGPQGLQGIQGPQGLQGPQGIQGIQGNVGTQGPLGLPGLQGIKGDIGNTGDVGAAGAAGTAGTQGIQGIQGIQGDTGITGAAGATGTIGTQGIQGIQGSTGTAGAAGVAGVAGAVGAQGIQGVIGDTGIQGIQGTVGAAGPQGLIGLQGSTGNTGAAGIQGITGNTGLTGPKGDTGAQGIQGIQGIKGDTGVVDTSLLTAETTRAMAAEAAAITTAETNAALDATSKANAAAATSTPIAHASNFSNPHNVTKAQVLLGNADNTSDALKPISNNTAAALLNKSDRLTTYNKIEVDAKFTELTTLAPDLLNTFAEVAAQFATDASGLSALTTAVSLKAPIASPTFTGTISGITKAMVGLSQVDDTSDILKPISTATANSISSAINTAATDATAKSNNAIAVSTPSTHMGTGGAAHAEATNIASGFFTSTEKIKLINIADNANNYILPIATASTSGGIKVGSGLSISNGILSAAGATNLSQGTRTATSISIDSSTGSSAQLSIADTTNAGIMSSAQVIKLNGIATNAMFNPMTSAGDMMYGGVGGVATRLAKPTVSGYTMYMATDTGVPYWGAAIPGTNATVTIGTITTIAAGSNATVTNVGNQTTAILNFQIPQGPSGVAGLAGSNSLLIAPLEQWEIIDAAATGTININIKTSTIFYYTLAATDNFTINVRGDASTTLGSLLVAKQSCTVVFLNTSGGVPKFPSMFKIDDVQIFPQWSGGLSPNSGNSNSTDAYTYVIGKKVGGGYIVLANQTKFA